MPASLPLEEGHLSQAQIDRYWRDGFLFPIEGADSAQAAAWRAEIEALEAEWLPRDLPHPLANYKRVNAHVVIPLAARIAAHPGVLDVVQGILGENILVWACEFFIKEANTTHIVSWHQDLTYWGLGATQKQVTAWMALSPATLKSGCMKFVPGSHKNQIVPHNDTFADNNLLSRGQEIAVEVDEDDATAIELQPGQFSLHHGLMFHGSGPNSSDDRRIGVVTRYISPDVKQEVADRDYAMLVRGADHPRNFVNIAPPPAPFAPQSLKLYEEIRNEQAKALVAGVEHKTSMYAPAATNG